MSTSRDDPGAAAAAGETFKARALALGLELDDAEAATLEQGVRENEDLLALVDASPRTPSEDPFDYMRSVRAWRQSHGG